MCSVFAPTFHRRLRCPGGLVPFLLTGVKSVSSTSSAFLSTGLLVRVKDTQHCRSEQIILESLLATEAVLYFNPLNFSLKYWKHTLIKNTVATNTNAFIEGTGTK